MAQNLPVRAELNRKGIDNKRISFNNDTGSVMVDNMDFMKPPKVVSGTAFTDQNSFNDAYNRFTSSQMSPHMVNATAMSMSPKTDMHTPVRRTPMTQPTTQAATSFQPTTGTDYNSLIRSIMDSTSNQQPIDPYSTAAYRAAQAQSERAQHAQTRAAQEAYGSAGFGRSTALGERVAGIAGDQQDYLMTQVVPQIVAQEEARRQQSLQNKFGILDALMAQENLAINQAGVTGTYLSPEMRNMYNEVLSLKQQWENAPVEQRPAIEARANAIRNQIAALGGDPSLVGADVTLQQASGNTPRFGIPTLAAQGQQFNQGLQTRQQDLSEMQIMATLTGFLPDGTPTNQFQQQQLENEWMVAQQTGTITPTLAQLYGLPENTPTFEAQQAAISNALQRAQIAISQQNADTAKTEAENSKLSRETQQQFQNGMTIYQQTGQMPDYMVQYGINVKALNVPETKEEVEGLYHELAGGTTTPEEALKRIDDAVKLGLKDEATANELRNSIYMLFPEVSPEAKEEQKNRNKALSTGIMFGASQTFPLLKLFFGGGQ